MVTTRPSGLITTPLPSRSVPRKRAVRAAAGTRARTCTTAERISLVTGVAFAIAHHGLNAITRATRLLRQIRQLISIFLYPLVPLSLSPRQSQENTQSISLCNWPGTTDGFLGVLAYTTFFRYDKTTVGVVV